MKRGNIVSRIDHTALKPDTTTDKVVQLCREAREHGFASVCINPLHVNTAVQQLRETQVAVCTVVGFPLGASTSGTKAFETIEALKSGATEFDMVMAVSALKERKYDCVMDDIKGVVAAAGGHLVKVIIETALLTDTEKEKACALTIEAGAHFVKTSTGFASGGATVDDVRLMRKAVGPDFGVKASGGIKTLKDAQAMISAGASRIGTSSGLTIAAELNSTC
jgi:deoxyribose-phosphate aldolase